MSWYYEQNGTQCGPVEMGEVHRRIDSGELSLLTLVWREGMANWLPIGQVPELSRTPAGVTMPQPQPGYPGYPMAVIPSSNGMALASLITGILSLVLTTMCVGFIMAIPAVIMGHIARGQIRRSPIPQSGVGMAVTGLVTGYLCLALHLALVVAMVFGFYQITTHAPSSTSPTFPVPTSPIGPGSSPLTP